LNGTTTQRAIQRVVTHLGKSSNPCNHLRSFCTRPECSSTIPNGLHHTDVYKSERLGTFNTEGSNQPTPTVLRLSLSTTTIDHHHQSRINMVGDHTKPAGKHTKKRSHITMTGTENTNVAHEDVSIPLQTTANSKRSLRARSRHSCTTWWKRQSSTP